MLSNEQYFKLISFFEFKRLPKLLKIKNNKFNKFLDKNIDYNQIFYASLLLSAIIFVFLMIFNFILFIFNFGSILFVFSSLVISLSIFYYLVSFPRYKYRLRVVEELSKSPLIMALLISHLRVNPNIESAVNKSLKERKDFVSQSFVQAVRNSVMGKNLNDELTNLAINLGEFSEGFKRAVFLIKQAVSERNSVKRNATLDRALKVFLKEIEVNTRFFSQKLASSSFIIFTVGVVLPLIGLSILPLLNFFSSIVSIGAVFLVVVCVSIFTLFFTNSALINRPVVLYLSQDFEREFDLGLFLSSLVVFIIFSAPSLMFVLVNYGFVSFGFLDSTVLAFGFIPSCWGFVLALSFYFYFSSQKAVRLINQVECLETDLPDIIYAIASDLDEGLPLESSLLNVSKRFNSKLSNRLRKARLLVKNRHLSIKDAFSKVFSNSNSFIVVSIFSFISESKVHGSKVLSNALFSLSDHINDVRRISRDLRVHLEHNLSMMQYSILLFAPVICGLVVVLNVLISSSVSSLTNSFETLGFIPSFLSFFGSSSVSAPVLSLFSFAYLLVFTFIVSRFIVYVKNGQNFSILKFELSKILLMVALLYSLTLLVSKKMLGV
jgi:hypothetical protein